MCENTHAPYSDRIVPVSMTLQVNLITLAAWNLCNCHNLKNVARTKLLI